jgi:hypothetical protein
MKIRNIELLRNHILESLEKLEENKIDIDEASIIAKSGETIISSLKVQLSYANMRGEEPNIKFIQDCNDSSKKQSLIDN